MSPIGSPGRMKSKYHLAVALLFFGSLYYFGSLDSKTWDITSCEWWNRCEDKNSLESKTQNTYRNQFQTLDKNKDYIIDSTEFIYRK